MPLFEIGDESGVYIQAVHLPFKRGRRLDAHQLRRMQDMCMCLLYSMGLNSATIAGMRRITPRQCRNVLGRDQRHQGEDGALKALAMGASLRFGQGWPVETRDHLISLLAALGADVEDISAILRWPRCKMMVRWRVSRIPKPTANKISLAAHRAIQGVKGELDSERARRDAAKLEPRTRSGRRRARLRKLAAA